MKELFVLAICSYRTRLVLVYLKSQISLGWAERPGFVAVTEPLANCLRLAVCLLSYS